MIHEFVANARDYLIMAMFVVMLFLIGSTKPGDVKREAIKQGSETRIEIMRLEVKMAALQRDLQIWRGVVRQYIDVSADDRWRRHEAAKYWQDVYDANAEVLSPVPFPLEDQK